MTRELEESCQRAVNCRRAKSSGNVVYSLLKH
jgi:hypothetical protein